MPGSEVWPPPLANVQVVASLRLGVYWQAEERPRPGLSLEIAPQVTHVFATRFGPVVGGYAQGRYVLGQGFSASVGGRAGAVSAQFFDCLAFLEWPGLKAELGHIWTREGPGWELGGEVNMIVGGLEVAYTRPEDPEEGWGLRTQAGLAVPLIPACSAGRPLRNERAARLPAVAWRAPSGLQAADSERWLQRGREEHASITAFLRLASELVALGAPRALIGGALRAAAEEAGHARLCFGQASLRARTPLVVLPVHARPRAWGKRSEALDTLAAESWIDGVLGEGSAARAALSARDRERDEEVAQVEDQIAREELTHARLGAGILDWCLREGGASTRRALRDQESAL